MKPLKGYDKHTKLHILGELQRIYEDHKTNHDRLTVKTKADQEYYQMTQAFLNGLARAIQEVKGLQQGK